MSDSNLPAGVDDDSLTGKNQVGGGRAEDALAKAMDLNGPDSSADAESAAAAINAEGGNAQARPDAVTGTDAQAGADAHADAGSDADSDASEQYPGPDEVEDLGSAAPGGLPE